MRSLFFLLIFSSLARATPVDCTGVADGTLCATGDHCTQNDFCWQGKCVAGPALVCGGAEDGCYTGTCDPEIGCVIKSRCVLDGGFNQFPAVDGGTVPQAQTTPEIAPIPQLAASPESLDAPGGHIRGDSVARGCQAAPSGAQNAFSDGLALLFLLATLACIRRV